MIKNNVLIIDDEEDILNACKNVLEDEGYDVDIANSYEEALKIFNNKKIDLVFLDVWLPNVIMMSGHAGVETAVRTTKMGAYDFLEKPISISKLLSSCDEVFKKENTQTNSNSLNNSNNNHHKSNNKYKVKQRTIAKSNC